MTTPEQNMAACREFNERVLNEGDVSYAEKMLRDDFVDHSPPPGGAGDKVAIHTRVTGTDTKGFMPGMTPTGKPFAMETIDVVTFDQDGMNTEHYGIADVAGVMMQLGLMPAPGGSA